MLVHNKDAIAVNIDYLMKEGFHHLGDTILIWESNIPSHDEALYNENEIFEIISALNQEQLVKCVKEWEYALDFIADPTYKILIKLLSGA